MFRFSLRELFLVTLIVAVALGWAIDRERWRARVTEALAEHEAAASRATTWRQRTGALEELIKDRGWDVEWNLHQPVVSISRPDPATSSTYREWYSAETDRFEPSIPKE